MRYKVIKVDDVPEDLAEMRIWEPGERATLKEALENVIAAGSGKRTLVKTKRTGDLRSVRYARRNQIIAYEIVWDYEKQ